MGVGRIRGARSEAESDRASLSPRALRADCRALSQKWHRVPPSLIPLDVADMDFGLDPAIASALRRAVSRPLVYPPSYVNNGTGATLSRFYERRYGLYVAPAEFWLVSSCVAASYLLLDSVLTPGDEVIYFAPSYHHVRDSIRSARGVPIPLDVSTYVGDADHAALEHSLSPSTRAIYLCNPHNPTGTVFGEEDLAHIAGVAADRDLVLLSNELHSRVMFEGSHVPIAGLSADARKRTVTLAGPTKSHNISGLGVAFAFMADNGAWRRAPERIGARMTVPKTVQQAALTAAYGGDSAWFTRMVRYLRQNRDTAVAGLSSEKSGIMVNAPQATYFLWLDLGARALDTDAATQLERECGVRLMSGYEFGADGQRWARMTLATERWLVEEAVLRLIRSG